MITLLRCVNGHEWQPNDSSDSAVPCPVCGAERPLQTSPTYPDAVPSLPFSDERGKASRDQPPPELGNYEILNELGRGGMGIVYKAVQRDNGRVVAIKVLRKERLGTADLIQRFRREALAASRVQHPNIVQVLEAELEGDTPYIAMEFVPGITLQKLVEEKGPLPLAQACDFIRQTALGLEHSAEQRLVHRDVKPSNLMMLAPEGMPQPARPIIKILDMGVARLLQLAEQDASITTLTRDGSVIGTPDYVAPEQLENPRGVDIRADLYSLGCTFYFLLTGTVPFPGGTLIQKLDSQRWKTAPSVNQSRPEVPPALATVVRRLMAKHPDDRYQTPRELVTALESLIRTGTLPGGHQLVNLTPAQILTGHSAGVTDLAFLSDGKTLVTGSTDKTLRLWDVQTGKELARLGNGKQGIGCIGVTTTGLVLAGQGVSVRVWDASNSNQVALLSGHTNAVRCMSLTPDQKRVLTGGDDRTVRLWDLELQRELLRFSKHRDGITGIAVTRDGRYVLSCSRDQTLRLWDISNGEEVRSFAVPPGPVLALALAQDGSAVLTGHFDTTIRSWDVATGREMRRFMGHKQMVVGLVGLPNGQVASVSHDQTVRLWEIASGAELGSGTGHTAAITAIAVSPDGRSLATSSLDRTIRFWELPR